MSGVPDGYERIAGYERLGPSVPGEGPILSTFVFRGDVYVCRLTDGEPAIYRAAPDGWEIVRPKWDEDHGNGR